jgi:hypothetical protein
MSVRAVGWNLGTVRELGGAPIDLIKALDYVARGAPPEDVAPELTGGAARIAYEHAKNVMDRIADKVGHKIAYSIALLGTTMILGAIINRLFGQSVDEIKDYFFPKTGGLTKQGTPERVSLPSYIKDLYEYATQPVNTVINKANPMFGIMHSIYANEDFFGDPVRSPDDDFWGQLADSVKYAAKETVPFAIQGTKQFAESGASGIATAAPYFGITPAPARVTSPEQMERYQHEREQQAYLKKLRHDLRRAVGDGDEIGAARIREEILKERGNARQTERAIREDRVKARDAAKKISSLIDGKPKDEQVAALEAAGIPAFAHLWALLPQAPRPRVARALANFA